MGPTLVTAAVVERDGRVLVTRRLEGTHLAGLWEFPGGKCEAGESLPECLARELREELGVSAAIGDEMFRSVYRYGEKSLELVFFDCSLEGDPRPLLGQEIRWVAREHLHAIDFPPADAELVMRLSAALPALPYNSPVKIYTRTGDAGDTGLLDGRRVPKSDPRVDAYGDVDELNACLGLAVSEGLDEDLAAMLLRIQRDLFALGGRLADPARRVAGRVEKMAVGDEDVARLEGWIDTLESELEPLRQFILPGGVRAAASLQVARAVCRRAERRIVELGRDGVEPQVLAFVNRLSDFLFVLARVVNRRGGISETEW
jgi:cob(I)alamin adenosyltransferase